MKYKIFSIDDSREHYKAEIRKRVPDNFWHCGSVLVNGHHRPSLDDAIKGWGIPIHANLKVGQLGVWYSFLNALDMAPIVTFDDDAMLSNDFASRWSLVHTLMPADTDFFSLFLPRDSDHMWDESLMINRTYSRVYARYGGVSFYYSERGKKNIMDLVYEEGITGQYDDTLYRWAKEGKLNGYCLPPSRPDLVYISGTEKSIVQESEEYV